MTIANIFSLGGFFLGSTGTILTIIIFRLRKSKLHFLWMFFNIAVALWGWGAYFIGKSSNSHEALIFWRISYVPILFISIFFFHVVYEFCNLSSKKILIFAYFQGILSGILSNFTDLYISDTRLIFNSLHYAYVKSIVGKISFLIWIGLVSYGIYQLFKNYLKQKGLKRHQISYFLIAIVTGFSSGLTNFFPYFGLNIYPFGNFGIVIYCIIGTYAIFRYRLMDINVVVKRTAVYSLSAGILASFFIVLILAMTKYLTNLAGITSFTITSIAAILIALLFNPIRNRVQTIIDKIFYKKTYDYYSTIQKVSHELVSTFSLKKIYNFVGDTILTTLGLKNIYLLSVIPGESYRMVYSTSYGKNNIEKDERAIKIDEGSAVRAHNTENRMQESEMAINGKSEIVKLLMTFKDAVIREELPQIHKISQEVVDKINTDLKPFKGEAVVPVFIDGKLELMIVLGEKLSGDIFSNEDIKLLHTISDQTAISVKNARLYMDKLRSDRLASIGMISATFAHEIKNPLTSIKTFAQLLPERHSDTDFRDNFSRIVIDGVNRIDGLIKDLLDLSSGKISAEMNTLNITSLIDEVIDEVKTSLELNRKKINIEKDYKDIEVDILGDEKRLRQAFTNIIMNGCQAIPDSRDDGIIMVSINPNGENVGILIADNGDGIPAEDIPRIFEPFFSTKTIGVGLGLAITKKIIEDHYGKIEVNSILKKGTIFRITLPLKKMGTKVGNLSTA